LNILLLVVAIFGFVLSTLLLIKKSLNKWSILFLSSFYFIYSLYTLQTYIIVSGLLNKFSWFYVWPLSIYSLFTVPVYFYFVTTFKGNFKWKWKYLILFIPFLISCIDITNVYIKTDTFYNQIIFNANLDPVNRFNVSYGLLSINDHYVLRHLWQLIYLILLFPKLKTFIKLNYLENSKNILNKWLLFFYASLFFFSFFNTFFGLEKYFEMNIVSLLNINNQTISMIIQIVFYSIILCIAIVPVYFPSIIHGYPDLLKITNKKSNLKGEGKSNFGVNEVVIAQKLKFIEKSELFLLHDFNLTMCSKELKIPIHHISYFLNHIEGISFADFRNSLRMKKAINLIHQNYMDINTVEALAWTCGFSSRSSFSKVFKQHTDLTLTEYLLKLKVS